jgi:hypothetical protein
VDFTPKTTICILALDAQIQTSFGQLTLRNVGFQMDASVGNVLAAARFYSPKTAFLCI